MCMIFLWHPFLQVLQSQRLYLCADCNKTDPTNPRAYQKPPGLAFVFVYDGTLRIVCASSKCSSEVLFRLCFTAGKAALACVSFRFLPDLTMYLDFMLYVQ